MFVKFPCKRSALKKKNAPFYKILLIKDFRFAFTGCCKVTLSKPHGAFFLASITAFFFD